MDFKAIYESKYKVEGLELDDSNDFETEKKNILELLKRARLCLGEAAEYGKSISYYQEPSPVDHDGGYLGMDNEWIEIPYTDEEKEKLDDYIAKQDEHHKKRTSQGVEKIDHDIYKLMDAIEELSEKIEKLED